MHSDVGGDVIAFDGGGSAGAPMACKVEIVGRLAAYMTFADVVLSSRLN